MFCFIRDAYKEGTYITLRYDNHSDGVLARNRAIAYPCFTRTVYYEKLHLVVDTTDDRNDNRMNTLESMNVKVTIFDFSNRMSFNRDGDFRSIDQRERMIDISHQRVRDARKDQKSISSVPVMSHAMYSLIVQQSMILAYLSVDLSSITSDLIRTVISLVSTSITTMITRGILTKPNSGSPTFHPPSNQYPPS